jgi:tetratricopeptide (TPR) repeat protein
LRPIPGKDKYDSRRAGTKIAKKTPGENPKCFLLASSLALLASWRFVLIVVFIICSGWSPCLAADANIPALIAGLSADDAAARQAAADQLLALGAAARPALVAATHGGEVETRSAAADLLLKMPWGKNDDPPKVQQILDRYVNYSDDVNQPPGLPATLEARKAAVRALSALEDDQGTAALIRLIYEDPSNSVRWTIFHELRTNMDSGPLAKLRRNEVPDDDPAMKALYGLAWLEVDASRAKPLLTEAVEDEFADPSDDGGEVDFVISCLLGMDVGAGQLDTAADLLRRELDRGAPTDRQKVPLPLLTLLVLQADVGPLGGLEDDIKRAADFSNSPKIQYVLAQIDARQGQTATAEAARKAAFAANSQSRLGRFEAAKFLADHGWDALAEAEYQAYLAMPPGDDQGDSEACDVNAHIGLSGLAQRRGDDWAAAQELKTAMSMKGGGGSMDLVTTNGRGRTVVITDDQIWAEIHWHYLRAALKSNDQPGAAEHLAELIKLAPTDTDIAIDVVPLLKQKGRIDEARHFFAAAHQFSKSRLDTDPANGNWMNGLAWLDAKCDEDLDEALKLATNAMTAMPRNSAVIDTLAEVHFHLGHFAKAVELEQRALALEPGDSFMSGQLARFKTAAEQKAH